MNDDLIEQLATFSDDPLGFVLWAFQWGEAGSELEKAKGPEAWQVRILEDLGKGLISFTNAIRLARTSGHGIGPSMGSLAWTKSKTGSRAASQSRHRACQSAKLASNSW